MTSRHPPGLALSQYVDSELPADRQEEVAHHLGRCDECRTTVDFYRRLRAAAGEPREVTVPDVADRVLQRRRDLRASGDKVLAGGDAQNRARRRLAMAASVVAALLIGSYLILAPSATAHRSSLRFESSLPRPGDVVDVEYSPSTFLADRDSLRLRIRARSAETSFPRQGIIGELRTATLHRNDAGRFESQVEIRPGDVYLAAAVEDFEGESIDTNLGRLWDVLVSGSSGEPSIAALESKYRALEPYNWVAASAWAAEAAEEYPQNPFGWALLYLHQSRAGSIPLSDSLSDVHGRQLERLSADVRELTADELEWLAFYARLQDAQALENTLLTRLARLEPGHPSVIDRRVEQVLQGCESNRSCILERLDAISRDISQPTELLLQLGVVTAAADGARVRQWIQRARQVPEVRPSALAALLDPFDELVLERLALRRAQVEELENVDDADRPLRLTKSEYREQVATSLRSARAKLAADLAVVGDTAGALETFARATEDAWKPDILRPFVDLLIATGDTVSAAPLVGLLLADPLFGGEAERIYSSIRIAPDERSQQQLEYRQRVRDSAVRGGRLPRRASLSLLSGETLQGGELAGSPAVIFIWEPDLPRAADLLEEFGEIDSSLWNARGIQRMILTHTADPLQLGSGPPVVRDPEYEVSQHLGAYRVPTFVVLNPELRVVAQTDDVSTAFRIASAFSTTAR